MRVTGEAQVKLAQGEVGGAAYNDIPDKLCVRGIRGKRRPGRIQMGEETRRPDVRKRSDLCTVLGLFRFSYFCYRN